MKNVCQIKLPLINIRSMHGKNKIKKISVFFSRINFEPSFETLLHAISQFQGRVRNTMTCRLEDEDGLPFYTKKCMTVWYFISCIIHMITIWIILCFNIVQSLCYFQKSVCCHTLSSRAQASRRIGPSKLYPPLVQNT